MSIDLFVCAVDNRPLLEHDDNPIDSREPDPWKFPGMPWPTPGPIPDLLIRFGSSVRDELCCLLLKRFCLGRCLSRLVTNGAPVCFRKKRSVFRIFNGVTRAGDAINKVNLYVCEVDDDPLLD